PSDQGVADRPGTGYHIPEQISTAAAATRLGQPGRPRTLPAAQPVLLEPALHGTPETGGNHPRVPGPVRVQHDPGRTPGSRTAVSRGHPDPRPGATRS